MSYKIYRETATGQEFVTSVKTLQWIDKNLDSYAFCYRVSAVDSQGREGEMSDLVCNDNCPYYELPNIFSPNNDGCNDTFSAYGSGNVPQRCDAIELQRCARFVESVDITILNRWGRKVYSYNSGGGKSIYVDWDGHDSNGNLLDPGIYFYVANVDFEVRDPKKKSRRFKGWVQLVR